MGGASFYVDTDAGTMRGSVVAGVPVTARRWSHGFVAFRFLEPSRAEALTHGVNPWSGKWNFHLQGCPVAAQFMAQRIRELNPREFRLIAGEV